MELDFDSSRIADEHTHKIASIRVDLKEYRFAAQKFWGRSCSPGSFRGIGSRAAELAGEHGVIRALRLFIDCGADLFADPRYFHVADQQRQRRSPVVAIPRRNARHRAI